MTRGCLWDATARETADYPALPGDLDVDVAIIGGGIHGLSAALAAAESGARVALLEAATIGAGASGRNGGLVVPSLPRVGPDEALRAMGEERGGRFIALVLGAPAEVFALIARHRIDCGAEQNGWLNPAHGPAMLRPLERRLEAWRRYGSKAELLDSAETQRRIGSRQFFGAIADPTGGHLNPLAYTRGLARAAAASGAAIHAGTPVRHVTREAEGWRLATPAGTVRAHRVLQATNAQPPGTPESRDVARSTVPLIVYQLATPKLTAEQRETILPGGEAMSDTRHNLFACCIDDSGRIVTGGMAPLTQLAAGSWLPGRLARRLSHIFPQLGAIRFEYVWSGRATLTRDFLPRLYEVAPGWYAPVSCNGRGVALSTALGTRHGRWLAGSTVDPPLAPTGPEPIALRPLAARLPQWALPLGMIADARNARPAASATAD